MTVAVVTVMAVVAALPVVVVLVVLAVVGTAIVTVATAAVPYITEELGLLKTLGLSNNTCMLVNLHRLLRTVDYRSN